MSRRIGTGHGLVVALLVAGCAAAPTPTPSVTGTPAASIVTAAPSATASPTLAAISTPTPTPTPAPSPTAALATATPIVSDPSTWATLTWQRLPANDPLAQIGSMIRWPGGLVAVGDLVTSPTGTRTVVFTSADGTSWSPIDPAALGPSTAVVGIAPAPSGVVLLTLQTDQYLSEDGSPPADGALSILDSWTLKGPLQSWTSSEGRGWTAHAIPQVELPAELNGQPGEHPALIAGAPGQPMLVSLGLPLAVSDDGVSWDAISSDQFPASWGFGTAIAASRVGFVAAVRGDGDVVEATSGDGRTWTTHTITTAADVVEDAIGGPAGVIVTGMTDGGPGTSRWRWWSTRNGQGWRTLAGYPPLGTMEGDLAQECAGSCPDGSLRGDSNRFFAYRGWGEQAAWTSADGRTWHRVALVGRPERSTGWLDDMCTQSIVLLPIGVTCHTSDEIAWFGEATP